jgi:hypothetical protein
MNKIEMITKIIFKEDDLSKVKFPVNEEIKQHFEIAWDIAENFEEIKKNIRKLLFNKLIKKLKEKYYNFEIINLGFTEGTTYGDLLIFPKNWIIVENKLLIYYTLEWEKNNYKELGYGIKKFSDKIPYEKKEIPQTFNELIQIQTELKEKGFNITDHFLSFKLFDNPFSIKNEKKFFEKILENGIEKVIDYYIEELDNLIKNTKNELNNFIEKYKKTIS